MAVLIPRVALSSPAGISERADSSAPADPSAPADHQVQGVSAHRVRLQPWAERALPEGPLV